MLNDFFKLNQPVTKIDSLDVLHQKLENTDSLRDFMFVPDLVPPAGYAYPKIKFWKKTFTNASFSKKLIKDVVFYECKFVDCLFIGARIENCEFINCRFDNVNTFKIEIKNTFLRPKDFKNAIKDIKHSNIAVHLFQKIYENLSDMDQLTIINNAEFYFRDWERKHIIQKRRNSKLEFFPYLKQIIPKTMHYLVGYGIRFEMFFATYLVFLVISGFLNHIFWDYYRIKTDLFICQPIHTVLHSLYFTFYTTTSLGAGEMFPQSDLGIIFAIIQSILGYIFIGVFLSMLIKKIIR